MGMDMALKALVQAGPLFSAVGDKQGEGNAFAKLANAYMMKRDPVAAGRAAQEAVIVFRKMGDKLMTANMLQAVAEVQFTLVGEGKGNGREAMRAATEAVSIYRELQDKAAEATTMHILANAQLMLRNFSEAEETAKAAQSIFQDLGDGPGEAGTLLLVAGSHLGRGAYEEAKQVAKDARDIYQKQGDEKGEDSADDFLDSLKDFESGKLNSQDFVGFSAQGQGERKPRDKKEKGKPAASQQQSNKADVWLFGTNPQGQRDVSYFCDAYEGRAATAPGARPGRSEKKDDRGYGAIEEKSTKDLALYVVRYVPLTEKDVPERDPAAEAAATSRVKREEVRFAESATLGVPKGGLLRTGCTSRMLEAVGAQRR